MFLADDLVARLEAASTASTVKVRGRVVEAVGALLRATGVDARLGELCELHVPGIATPMLAEVVGFSKQGVLLSCLAPAQGVSPNTQVIPLGRGLQVKVSEQMLGRIVDGFGEPLDGKGPIPGARLFPVDAPAPRALDRPVIDEVFATGVRVVDAMLSMGLGQRMGIFAAAGVGKSVLLGMMARHSTADLNVVTLVGERGREVREFIERNLGSEGLARSVVVVSTSDRSSIERVKCPQVACAIAEYFRDRGCNVLLLVDSLTRYARALREVGLASGEPPVRRGFPPSMFVEMPRLLERAGRTDRGSITAFYTVLTEGEDGTDLLGEEVRSILDGHVVLSRKLAAAGQFPAIDLMQSLSRLMLHLVSEDHGRCADRVRSWIAKHAESELLVQLGEYKPGTDAATDQALEKIDEVRAFMKQGPEESSSFDETTRGLAELADDAMATEAGEDDGLGEFETPVWPELHPHQRLAIKGG